MKLKIDFKETISLLNGIQHNSLNESVLNRKWKPFYVLPNGGNGKYGEMKAQAVCWLYCWGMTGMNSQQALRDSRYAFNRIFEISFEQYPQKIDGEFHQWAREIRNRSNGDFENDLIQKLGYSGNPVLVPHMGILS